MKAPQIPSRARDLIGNTIHDGLCRIRSLARSGEPQALPAIVALSDALHNLPAVLDGNTFWTLTRAAEYLERCAAENFPLRVWPDIARWCNGLAVELRRLDIPETVAPQIDATAAQQLDDHPTASPSIATTTAPETR